jgi:histidinol phosphatase-like enzyme (inositol monophosphatase family)
MTDEIHNRLDLALKSAVDAGHSSLEFFRHQTLEVIWKGDGSPVSQADEKAEGIIVDAIHMQFPDDSIIGEEGTEAEGSSGYHWIIDPLDGTEAFIRKIPIWGVLIAIEKGDEIVAGLVYMPAQRELAWASKGNGCMWVEETDDDELPALRERAVNAHVSNLVSLEDAMISTTGQGAFYRSNSIEKFMAMRNATRKDRGFGHCWGHLLVVTGRMDLSFEPKIQVWDVAPFQIMVTEAGGKFSDFIGNPTAHSGNAVISNGHIHDAAIDAMNKS